MEPSNKARIHPRHWGRNTLDWVADNKALSFITLIALLSWTDTSTPENPTVLLVRNLMVALTPVFAIVLPVLIREVKAGFHGEPIPFDVTLRALLHGLIATSFTISVINGLGDDVYQFVAERPENALALIIAGVLVHMLYQATMTPYSAYGHTRLYAAEDVESYARMSRPSATPTDMRIVAAHECGHAMVYAALPNRPADLEVKIHPSVDESGHLGHVGASITENLLRMPEFARWHMMLTLAGRMGEHQLHGEGSLGSSRDMTQWLEIAHLYLSNHCEGVYYSEPKNAVEMAHNQTLLEQLKSRQLILLREFFNQNKETHQAMTEHLLEHHSLDAESLKQWLDEIKIPTGFPQPKFENDTINSDPN